ncbi:hypothetical protein [Litoreibacter roseus]|uniref:hypothetical protein n=1 Tax=Litoreibacter roseus TaxID=2601869 RepID=UPI001359174E|nr:hypothetical protein [Litoreibacter roseus]
MPSQLLKARITAPKMRAYLPFFKVKRRRTQADLSPSELERQELRAQFEADLGLFIKTSTSKAGARAVHRSRQAPLYLRASDQSAA